MPLATRTCIQRAKRIALRTGIWFEALSRVERAIIDLTMKCVERVRSSVLAKAIMRILGKILQGNKIGFLAEAERIGLPMAQKLGVIAERWGNKGSLTWKKDAGYVRFLGITTIYAQA